MIFDTQHQAPESNTNTMDNDNTHNNDYLSARRPDSISPSTDERRDEDGEQNEDDYKVATTTASSSRSYAISYYPVGRDQGSVSPAYTYTDYYSRMPSAATHSLISQTDQAQRSGHNADIRVQVLPVKLAAILAEPKFAHIITWMPHGRAWKVLRLKEFTKQVAPQYFEYPNYNSFIRLVNAWGFRRIKTGVDANAYFHEVSSVVSYVVSGGSDTVKFWQIFSNARILSTIALFERHA